MANFFKKLFRSRKDLIIERLTEELEKANEKAARLKKEVESISRSYTAVAKENERLAFDKGCLQQQVNRLKKELANIPQRGKSGKFEKRKKE